MVAEECAQGAALVAAQRGFRADRTAGHPVMHVYLAPR